LNLPDENPEEELITNEGYETDIFN